MEVAANSAQAWLLALRPRTLGASVVPVVPAIDPCHSEVTLWNPHTLPHVCEICSLDNATFRLAIDPVSNSSLVKS
jgi:hypothetical protein